MPAFGTARSAPGAKVARVIRGDGKREGLRAVSGQVIRHVQFLNLGNGAVRVDRETTGLVIEDCEARDLYRFLENTAAGGGSAAPLSRFVIRRVRADGLARGMTRIRYGSHNGLIEDVIARGARNAERYCVGFALDDEAHDIVYRRVEAHGFAEGGRHAGEYWNGDGFTDERGNRAISYIACTATGCTDGGFDLKSSGVLLTDCVARSNKRNYRLWGDGTLRNCASHDPVWHGGKGGSAHFSFHGGPARFLIDRPVVRAAASNRAPVFLVETSAPAEIEIRNADIVAPGAPLFAIKGPAPIIRWVPARKAQRIRTM